MSSINELLGTLPSGRVVALPDDEVVKKIRDDVQSDAEKSRRLKARMRVDLYRGRGQAQINQMLQDVFKNKDVREARKKFVEIASYQNLTNRIVREISTVYSEPAVRTIAGKNKSQAYRHLQARLRLDRHMRKVNRSLNLLNECVIWFDQWMGDYVIRTVTPDNFSAISHPNDPLTLVALVIDQVPTGNAVRETDPHYLVMTDTEFFKLDKNLRLVPESRQAHGLERMPMILAHRTEPETALLDADPGSDIIAAHKAVTLLNVMLMKHQKSGTKQGYLSGDVGDMAMGQPMDEEHILMTPEGTTLSTLDLAADPENYINATRFIIKQVAANYGIPESVFDLSYQATSGFEIELKRTGLREIRRDQILDFRPLEREFAEIMSSVLRESSSPDAFAMDGWSIDFGEVETPRDPMQMLAYWKELRSMGLINTADMYQVLNPEATEDDALNAIRRNALIEAERVRIFRELNISPGAASDGSDDNEGSRAPFNGESDESDDEEEATA